MKEENSAWDDRVARERPKARSQPKFPWQVSPPEATSEQPEHSGGPASAPENELGEVITAEKEAPPQPDQPPNLATEKPGYSNQVTEKPSYSVTMLVTNKNTGFYTVPNLLDDEITPTLTLAEQTVLRRLFRLSYGFNRPTTGPVSIRKISEKCNLSASGVKLALKSLEAKKLIRAIGGEGKFNPQGGNRYHVLPNLVTGKPSHPVTRLLSDPITIQDDDDDDDSKIHHHQKAKNEKPDDDDTPHLQAVKHLYSKLTGNQWTAKDQTAYKAIAPIKIDLIESVMSAAKDRASSRINSLNYFLKEILSAANPSDTSRAQIKKRLTQIVHRTQEAYVGSNPPLTIPDLEEKVMLTCEREGVYFDKHLFNDILDRKA